MSVFKGVGRDGALTGFADGDGMISDRQQQRMLASADIINMISAWPIPAITSSRGVHTPQL
jgi:hypothetical protein